MALKLIDFELSDPASVGISHPSHLQHLAGLEFVASLDEAQGFTNSGGLCTQNYQHTDEQIHTFESSSIDQLQSSSSSVPANLSNPRNFSTTSTLEKSIVTSCDIASDTFPTQGPRFAKQCQRMSQIDQSTVTHSKFSHKNENYLLCNPQSSTTPLPLKDEQGVTLHKAAHTTRCLHFTSFTEPGLQPQKSSSFRLLPSSIDTLSILSKHNSAQFIARRTMTSHDHMSNFFKVDQSKVGNEMVTPTATFTSKPDVKEEAVTTDIFANNPSATATLPNIKLSGTTLSELKTLSIEKAVPPATRVVVTSPAGGFGVPLPSLRVLEKPHYVREFATSHRGQQSKEDDSINEDEKACEDSIYESEPDLPEEEGKPRKLSQRKQAEKIAFDASFQDHLRRRAQINDRHPDQAIALEDRTTNSLSKDSIESIISNPREYQIELYEIAKEKNVIAVLDTGSGKTLISVLLLRYTFEQELERRALGMPKRISFFLVHSVPLVFQQFEVLNCNLDQPMAKFCGGVGSYKLWSKAHWADQLESSMVVVCTADILYHCLHHAFVSMQQINLLIFDEAHHAKKNHSYSRIIKDFYTAEVDKAKRPKIFGMTASPVDSKTDVRVAATQLESLLDSHIVTASDPSLLQYTPLSKRELLVQYSTLRTPFETPLYEKVKVQFNQKSVLARELTFAKEASSELGHWCSDQIWSMCLTEEKCKKLQAKVERKFHANNEGETIDSLDARKAEVLEARKVVDAHKFDAPLPTLQHLSSKVIALMEYLKSRFERPTTDKCIVFVTQRYTAKLLTELFQYADIGTHYLRPGFLIGSISDDIGDIQINHRQQVLTLVKFRRGDYNCLFATSVAEEGLDIPDCNLVIRFDLYTTLIQYIQSRGRARRPNSVYVHMTEMGNREHSSRVRDAYSNEGVLRHFCQSLDPSRLLTGNDYDMNFFLAKEKKHRVYIEPETGSKLTYRLSMMVLENFISSLPACEDGSQSSAYVMTTRGQDFCCEVILPSNSPVHGAVGRPASTKQVAKCSAAFEACLNLRKGGHLDAHFLSTFAKQKLAMQNAHLAVSSKNRARYDMRTKPQLWSIQTFPEELYMTFISLSNPSELDRRSQPLGLLSRTRLPSFPRFPVHFSKNRKSDVVTVSFVHPIKINNEGMIRINSFTLRIFDDVFSKEYESDIPRISYFLVPIRVQEETPDIKMDNPTTLIAWDILDFVQEHKSIELNMNASDSFFEDRYIVDPYDGSRKLWTTTVSRDFKPLDPLPSGVAPRSGSRRNNSNILEYSCSLWAKSRTRRTFNEHQPVVEAELIPLRRNLLDDTHVEASKPEKCFIVLEPLMISALPTTVVVMAHVFPAVIHRLESYLIALEACDLFHLQIEPALALEAITKDSDNSAEHSMEQVQFQRGMGNNYERLEFLGDCFLKMATSTALYSRHPENDENNYHVDRMLMLCNQNLLNVAQGDDVKLHEFIRSQSFNRRAWYPEGLVLKRGKTATAATTHDLSDKTIADVCEALIGAALLSKGFDQATRAVRVMVDSQEHPMDRWNDYYSSYTKPNYQVAKATESQKDMAARIEKIHPYHFKHPRLLRSAFTHPSYPFIYEHIPNYQRLEFLGDSVLDMACINYLFHSFPARDPQWLTEHKMAMVANQFLGALCVHMGFHKHLLQFNPKIQSAISAYVDEIKVARESAESEAVQMGNAPSDCIPDYWVHTKQPPKCLPDIIEAYIGAIFVDSEYDFAEVEKFFEMHIKWFFKDMKIYDTFANKHPVTFLTNFLEINMGCHNFSVGAKELPDLGDNSTPLSVAMVLVHGKTVSSKEGLSQRYAKVAAAKMAMDVLEGISLPDFRKDYSCNCKPSVDESVAFEEAQGNDLHGTAI